MTRLNLKKIKLMKQSVIHSFYQTKRDSVKLVRKLLNVGSNQSVSLSKLYEVNPMVNTVSQSVNHSINHSFNERRAHNVIKIM